MIPYLEIDRGALDRNAQAIIAQVQVPVIGVCKCDGYGLSLVEAARVWRRWGAAMLAVSRCQDVMTLRQEGFTQDILLLSPVAEEETLRCMVRLNAILPVTSLETARFYSRHSTRPVQVHVAVDTGMGRFGLSWKNTEELFQVYETENLRFLGIYSHFSASFEGRFQKTRRQLDRFWDVCCALEERGCPVGLRHIANSCAALRFPDTRLDAVRIGSALVGRLSAPVPLALEPVATGVAQVVDRKHFSPGDTTGYGSVCRIAKPTSAIVVALGHENGEGLLSTPDHFPLRPFLGYLRQLLQKRKSPAWVCFEGRRLPLIGRMGSQFSLYDAGDLDIPPGSPVYFRPNLLHPWANRHFVRKGSVTK